MDSISKQKKYLSKNLIVESLRTHEESREEVKDFLQAKYGNKIADYLNDNAWDEDIDNKTKVFLVRDKKTNKIVFYFALNCGILYKELNKKEMNLVEQRCVNGLITAMRQNARTDLSIKEREAANILLSEAYEAFDIDIKDSDRATDLITYAQEQATIKEEKEESVNEGEKSECIKNVQDTYPAIDIKFLCRNANYKPEIKLDFRLGVYVFWEIIVPHILKISELVGCQYVYLFAADNSGNEQDTKSEAPIIHSKGYDYDLKDDDETNGSEPKKEIKRLVAYYINDLKFRPVSEYTILKPHFERRCYTLIQDVSELAQKRKLIWASHDENNEIGSISE